MLNEVVKFTKLRSATEPSFWAKFEELKLDKYKLEDKIKISLWGSYSLTPTTDGRASLLVLDCTSFNENAETTTHDTAVPCTGFLVNTNTYEAFRWTNPETFINSLGQHILDAIKNGTALQEPWQLTFFIILSYADLKRHRFHYWTAYPTPFNLPETYHYQEPRSATLEFTQDKIDELQKSFLKLPGKSKCFFCVFKTGHNLEVVSLAKGVEWIKSNVESHKDSKLDNDYVYFAFYDPSTELEPGWPLRNLLCLLFWHCPFFSFQQEIKVLSVRGQNLHDAIVFSLKAKTYDDSESIQRAICENRLVGWETNVNGKLGPNIVDLSSSMDVIKLCGKAVDLNLKLMKWRLVPELNLDAISGPRYLLLGAGTLGCAVARVLIGWGITNLTIVDSSHVSHSNPVRQSLYTHEDAVKRRYKAEAAKDALLRIRPDLNVESVILQIPMPGHVVGESMLETTRNAISQLENLVSQHDVCFLLLDSREARWLPTVLGATFNKIVINAALGFDSYTVQRHGSRGSSHPDSPDLTVQNPTGQDLGCYFCNDITQPGNSQLDRTLDQQCTVSRPGLSQIAAGLAVELMVAITQHPQGIEAKAMMNFGNDQSNSNKDTVCEPGLLGGVPHTIRGSLWNHEMRLTITHRFPSCTACSAPLINEYKCRGIDFVLDACNQPNYLERLSGLEELLMRPGLDELCYALEMSSDEDEENVKTN